MLKFEEWLVAHKEQKNTAAYGLFDDSLRCMKFDIDRPAYLMAYQVMIRHIRDVIVFGERPSTFTDAAWNDLPDWRPARELLGLKGEPGHLHRRLNDNL